MSDADIRGRFLWHELMTTDPARAQEFYTKAIGWGVHTATNLGSPYVMFTRDGTGLAGVWELPEDARKMGAPPHWMAYIGTPNVDDTVRQATSLGAKTYVPPTDIPTVGRFAVLADPDGAVFAVFTPASGEGTEAAATQIGVLVARTRGQGPRRGVRLLQRALRLGEDGRVRHGADGDLPDVRA